MIAICQEWAPWSAWTSCSVSCGEGERKRTRECIGGRDCPGVGMAAETCVTPSCPSWSDWGAWEGCSITCGQGHEQRSRKCQEQLKRPAYANVAIVLGGPLGRHGHHVLEVYRTRECEHGSCEGASEERLLCNQQDCPAWTEWTAWTVCANKCDEDTYRIRNRICMYGGVSHSGCEGPAQDQSSCPSRACATWSDWSEWTRTCEGGSDCMGSNREIRFCQLASCPYWDEWMDWGGCSVTCGMGVCERRRRCVTDDLLNLPNLEELDEALFEMDSGEV
ncbi:thrombospondin type 1 domain protein [Cooperia oncophora]